MKSKPIIIGIIILVVLIVLIQNTQVVTLRLFFWKVGMSQIVLIPLILFIGFVLGYLTHVMQTKKRKLN